MNAVIINVCHHITMGHILLAMLLLFRGQGIFLYYSPGWPHTHGSPPVSASQGLGLQVWTTQVWVPPHTFVLGGEIDASFCCYIRILEP